jgi:hypothetical protein
MIRLKQILTELANPDINRLLDKIQKNQFRLFGQGDNGSVYEIDGEDFLFKITEEPSEYEVASKIVNQYTKYSTFIPIYYVDGKNIYIMSRANDLSAPIKSKLEQFILGYKSFAQLEGGEVSIFDYLDTINNNNIITNFVSALKYDVDKIAIPELDLDLDFKSDNIMQWNGQLVMIDW